MNDACTSSDKISSASTDYRNGTCVTSSECIDRGGSAKGNCAAGFGVCCVKIIDTDDNTDVTHNDTYLQNPDFPTSYNDEGSITYKVSKINNDICFLRLDFEQFDVIEPTGATLCADTNHLEITGGDLTFPAVCGNLQGSHMYVTMGNDDSDTVDIKVNVDGDANGATRKWEIKVAQIPCFSDYSPPDGCTQWFTEPSGTITDWSGADNKLQDNVDYQVCVRQNMGYCCVEYQSCDGFKFGNGLTTGGVDAGAGATCEATAGLNGDWISIDGAGGHCGGIVGINKFCGSNLHFQTSTASAMVTNSIPVCDCTAPFKVGVHLETVAATVADSGLCLNYNQVKC